MSTPFLIDYEVKCSNSNLWIKVKYSNSKQWLRVKHSNIKCVKHWICLLHVGRLSHTGADCWNARLFIAYAVCLLEVYYTIEGHEYVSTTALYL